MSNIEDCIRKLFNLSIEESISLKIVKTLLMHEECTSIKDICKETAISGRTIERYLNKLQEFGIVNISNGKVCISSIFRKLKKYFI